MPIFEFLCQECGTPFEELLRSSDSIDDVICPNCSSNEITKLISTFASQVNGSGGTYSSAPAASCSSGSL